MVPCGLSRLFKPRVKSLMSGTWAYTLLPMIRSACCCAPANASASAAPKNSCRTGIPSSLAAAAVLAVGSMPRTGNTSSHKILEQVAVVGGDFDYQTMPRQRQPRNGVFRIARGMGHPTCRGAREICVIGAEKLVDRSMVLGLDQPALVAHHRLERVVFFRAVQVFRGQVGVRGRGESKVEERVGQRVRAVSALHGDTPLNVSFSMGCWLSREDTAVIGSGQAMASSGSFG